LRGPGDTWGFILAAALVCSPAFAVTAKAAQNEIAAYQARFEREKDPVHKAKLMPRLGAAEFDEIEGEVNQGNIAGALEILEQYRDEARSCVEGLDAKKINAARHSSGFKQLQISLQEALRRLDQILPGLTADQQPRFLAVRGDLQKMNDHLVQELFPSSPAANPPAEKSNH
jgi:hypothetical protein